MSKVSTTVLDSKDLRYLLIDNLKLYSDFSFFIEGDNPYHFTIDKKSVRFFISNTHSTGRGRDNPDECRIQVSKRRTFLDILNTGDLIFFLGYSGDYGTLTAWNPLLFKDRINKKNNISLFSRFSIQKKASEQGIAVYEDNKGQKVISFRPEYLGVYLENYSEMHQSSEKSLLNLIQQSDELEETSGQGKEIIIEEEKFVLTKQRQVRDPRFRKKVYLAYGDRCAFTGMQLDLIEAAHIVPHSHKSGTDEIQNGICLSPLHHKAYDAGLIYVDEDYKIHLNEEKVRYLEKVGKDGGLKKFADLQYEMMKLPSIESQKPSKEYIQMANKIRGII